MCYPLKFTVGDTLTKLPFREFLRTSGPIAADGAMATSLYEKACGLGYSSGCYWAGYAYEMGFGVPKDRAKALAFYRKGKATAATVKNMRLLSQAEARVSR